MHPLRITVWTILAILAKQAEAGSYTDPLYQTSLPFGVHSHWVQPWRAYLETMSATRFLNGVGVCLGGGNPDLILQMLSKHGVKLTRLEIGWGALNYSDGLIHSDKINAALAACKKWGIRPIILLNANSGVPCPLLFLNRKARADAATGARSLNLADVSGLVAGRSGFNNFTKYMAAEILISEIHGNTVTLSKPLPRAVTAGQALNMATLKYRPFSVPGSADYNETLAGWQSYVAVVADLATSILGAGNFDLEVWNELTFGSDFLYINNYYSSPIATYPQTDIFATLVKATADVATANPVTFTGVEISDGFANTIPWPASSKEPLRVTAISKHPYAQGRKTPIQEAVGASVNALFTQENPPKFVPSYNFYFPECVGTAFQTEHWIRDMSPIVTTVYGTAHGRNGRIGEPCYVWGTEAGYQPKSAGITDLSAALALKAKSTARYFCFFLNKGMKKLTLFSASGGDTALGIVQDNFLSYVSTNRAYPDDDSLYTSPALMVTKRLVDKMSEGLDASLATTRSLEVTSITDTHDHYQFTGDGTLEHPTLFDRDALCILPFQLSKHKFVIPFYVMTRSLVPSLAPESFTINLKGFCGQPEVTAYDPINDVSVPLDASFSNEILSVRVNATDYPYLLTVSD